MIKRLSVFIGVLFLTILPAMAQGTINTNQQEQQEPEITEGPVLEDLNYKSTLDEYGDWHYLPGYGWVWVPRVVSDDWRPYYHGRWINHLRLGWYWDSYEPFGWLVFHYGRWQWHDAWGWYWIPMSHWGPAWVNWYLWDDYYCWCPMWHDDYYYHRYRHHYTYAHSRAWTVVHKNQLKSRIPKVALSESLKQSIPHEIDINRIQGRIQERNIRPTRFPEFQSRFSRSRLSEFKITREKSVSPRTPSKSFRYSPRSSTRSSSRSPSRSSSPQKVRKK